MHMGDTLAGRVGSSKCGTVNKVGDHVGEFFDLNGFPIPAKKNANDAIRDSAMGDSAGSKGDRGSKEDRALGDSAGSRERIQVISGWKSLFSAKTVTKSPLEFVASEIVNGKPVIEPPAVIEGMML